MKSRQKRCPQEASNKIPVTPSSNVEEDGSDVDKNFSLLTGRYGRQTGKSSCTREEEEEFSSDEDDEGSASAVEESGDGEEDRDSEAPDEEEEDHDGGVGTSEIQTREDIKKELSNMSFEDILKLQNRVGTRVFNEVAYEQPAESQKEKKNKRLNKNRPTEVSTKRPAPFLRKVVPVRRAMFRDPRFDDLSGEYKPQIFEKTYKFIDDIKHREKEMVQKQLKKTKNDKRKEKLHFLLKRMDNQERAKKNRDQQRERELQFRKQQRERANHGAMPFFLKNSEKKKLQLAEKYEQLKKSGKLENFLSKKRKRNTMKDRRKLPGQQSRKKP
ncbi:ribosomal RNA processing protein 36 homolog [Takifugu flavidus]|uniref:ribosomal RNA processing protein 36 homolog n=1 Tax=Takifugu flavidus TaxID=433684 RepID=UPI002544465A|nr:ribosomal RNA processing protein 36 homolog [Takifugu flavidus]